MGRPAPRGVCGKIWCLWAKPRSWDHTKFFYFCALATYALEAASGGRAARVRTAMLLPCRAVVSSASLLGSAARLRAALAVLDAHTCSGWRVRLEATAQTLALEFVLMIHHFIGQRSRQSVELVCAG